MSGVVRVARSWTGQASCHSWHYEFTIIPGGDQTELRLRLCADESTGGNSQSWAEQELAIRGEWEAREFVAVLLDLVMNLTANGLRPWEIFPTRDIRENVRHAG